MNGRIVITGWNRFVITAFYDGKRISDLDIYEPEKISERGNMYVGRVMEIVKNINAAFIEYEDGIKGYYSINDNKCPIFLNNKSNNKICIGDKILVQLSKDAIKTKYSVLTSKLEFPGKYVVLTYGDSRLGFSGKFKNSQKRENLTEIFRERYNNGDFPDNIGFIIRTNAEDADEKEILAETYNLVVQYRNVKERAQHLVSGSRVYTALKSYQLYARDMYKDSAQQIITDDERIYAELKEVCDEDMLTLYRDDMLPLIKLYSIESLMESIQRERVWLDSGAYIVIQHTEALSVIDVNTGKCIKGKTKSDFFLKINIEAAKEAARQIRLRNMSGIIIIDFINMNNKVFDEKLMTELKIAVAADRIKTNVVDMTALGLVEITRKKQKPPLHELQMEE